MIIVIVEHFLNEEGNRYFPQWIEEARSVISRFEGFMDIKRMEDVENVSRSVLILQFQRLDLLRLWAKSPEHDQLVGQLDPYIVQKRQSKVYSVAK